MHPSSQTREEVQMFREVSMAEIREVLRLSDGARRN